MQDLPPLEPVLTPPQYEYSDMSSNNTQFWGENPNVLFQVAEFYPVDTMSYNQKLNAVSRTVIILTIISLVFTRSVRMLAIAIITLGAIFFLHKYDGTDLKKRKAQKEAFENPALEVLRNQPRQLGPETFISPSSTNPYSNVMLTDYDDQPMRAPAPPSFEPSTYDEIMEQAKQSVRELNPGQPEIADKLFKDLGDAFIYEQSLRPFNSNPSTTIPNDQAGFADFCYGSMVSCKEGNLFACARNLDRHIM